MNLREIEELIYLLKRNGVSRFESKELSLRFSSAPQALSPVLSEPGPPLQAIPPVEAEIKHHANEVKNLLKLSDEELVDKMFPDYTKPPEA